MRGTKAVEYVTIAKRKFKILQEGKRKYIQMSLQQAKNIGKAYESKTTVNRLATSVYEEILSKRIEFAGKVITHSSYLKDNIEDGTFMYFYQILSDDLKELREDYIYIINLIMQNVNSMGLKEEEKTKLVTYLERLIEFTNVQVTNIINKIPNNAAKREEKNAILLKKYFDRLLKGYLISYLSKLTPYVERLKPKIPHAGY